MKTNDTFYYITFNVTLMSKKTITTTAVRHDP